MLICRMLCNMYNYAVVMVIMSKEYFNFENGKYRQIYPIKIMILLMNKYLFSNKDWHSILMDFSHIRKCLYHLE